MVTTLPVTVGIRILTYFVTTIYTIQVHASGHIQVNPFHIIRYIESSLCRLARKFLERVTRDFVEKVQRRRSDSFPILSNTTQIVKRKLADLRVKIRIATRLVERTDSLNDMNAETIRQLSVRPIWKLWRLKSFNV